MIKYILAAIFLAASLTWAQNSECLMEGQYSVETVPYGSREPFWIEGYVGRDRIRWDVMRYHTFVFKVRGWVKNTPIDLELDMGANPFLLTGWINRTYINWRGLNGRFFGYQACVR